MQARRDTGTKALQRFVLGGDPLTAVDTLAELRRQFREMPRDRHDSFKGLVVQMLLQLAEARG
ncbi:MAG: hypothetical protein HYR63_29975 [Proteobacteria bacterium]|nr:hypothetical protein [Pseudomonadota bacterium]MBI3498100.1 hypothetical protein [Pseudomonadota bacterium]